MAKRGRPQRSVKLSLAKAVSQTLEKKVRNGVLARDGGAYCYDLLTQKDQRDVGERECWAALKNAMKRGGGNGTSKQAAFPFPGLYAAYTLDDDGERSIKRTEMLSHLEFKRAIALRERQLTSDTEALQALRGAHGKVKTIWDKHPDKNFGEICELYKAKAAAA